MTIALWHGLQPISVGHAPANPGELTYLEPFNMPDETGSSRPGHPTQDLHSLHPNRWEDQ
jgi:hypothetical protein